MASDIHLHALEKELQLAQRQLQHIIAVSKACSDLVAYTTSTPDPLLSPDTKENEKGNNGSNNNNNNNAVKDNSNNSNNSTNLHADNRVKDVLIKTPVEIWLHVCLYLFGTDIISLSVTCKTLHQALQHPSLQLKKLPVLEFRRNLRTDPSSFVGTTFSFLSPSRNPWVEKFPKAPIASILGSTMLSSYTKRDIQLLKWEEGQNKAVGIQAKTKKQENKSSLQLFLLGDKETGAGDLMSVLAKIREKQAENPEEPDAELHNISFNISNLQFHMFWRERAPKKAYPMLAHATALVFCIPVDSYDMMTPDLASNQLQYYIESFQSVARAPCMRETAFIIFFTNVDNMDRKLRNIPFSASGYAYTGPDDADSCCSFIEQQLLFQLVYHAGIYICNRAVPEAMPAFLFQSVKDAIVAAHLRSMGLSALSTPMNSTFGVVGGTAANTPSNTNNNQNNNNNNTNSDTNNQGDA